MNDLERFFTNNTDRVINKWQHYFEIYDRHFSRFRGTDVHVLEIGVFHGGSLQMWKEYFGKDAKIFGADINPHCEQLCEDQIEIFIGDQEDREFLRSLASAIPRVDILIDDGGHRMPQQINTFEELFPHIDKNGVFLCEDLMTSYWREYGGGFQETGTFIEYSKNLIDSINAWHSQQPEFLEVSDFTRSANSLHFYDGVLVIEKQTVEKPHGQKTGTREIPPYEPPHVPPQRSLLEKVKRKIARYI